MEYLVLENEWKGTYVCDQGTLEVRVLEHNETPSEDSYSLRVTGILEDKGLPVAHAGVQFVYKKKKDSLF